MPKAFINLDLFFRQNVFPKVVIATHDLKLKISIQTFDAFVRYTLMGNQPWPQFQNGIRERSIVQFLPAAMIPITHSRHVSSLVSSCVANRNQRDMAKQLLTPLQLIARMNFSLKINSCELLNLTRTVGKVELISTYTTAVCERWNVCDKYTWDNAGDLRKLSMDQTLSEDNRSN